MGVHPWPVFDPGSAFMTMTGGAWAGPMHAAGAALTELGGQVHATVASSAVNDTVVGESWSGTGRISAASSVTMLNTDQTTYAALSELKAQLLHAAGELHTMTVPTMVTDVQADANRGEWGIDNAINPLVWGALTPRIADLDTEYFGFMWPNNASAGLRYGAGLDALGAALSGLSALPSIAGGVVSAPATAAADVASNAGMSMMSAVMSTTQQAATSAMSPSTSGGSQGSSLMGQSPLSAPSTSSSMSGISPLANVQSQAPVSSSVSQYQPSAVGMFAPPAAAALTPSAPAMPASPPVQTMTPSAAAPGVTSFAKPAEPFNPPPPPSGGKAAGLKPGMLNASALRGPVGTAPGSTALLTKPLTATSSLATQPSAYVTPQAPQSISSPSLLQDSGSIQTLNPPPQPQQFLPQHTPPPQPSAGEGPPPGQSNGSGGPDGSRGQAAGNTRMAGFGRAPLPLDPTTKSPAPEPPRCEPKEQADLIKKFVELNVKIDELTKETDAWVRKYGNNHVFDGNDPKQVAEYNRGEELKIERGKLIHDYGELLKDATTCGATQDEKTGDILWPDGTRTTLGPPK